MGKRVMEGESMWQVFSNGVDPRSTSSSIEAKGHDASVLVPVGTEMQVGAQFNRVTVYRSKRSQRQSTGS